MEDLLYYRRNLPHFHPKNGVFFITFRLANSLPAHVVRQLRQERDSKLKTVDNNHSSQLHQREKYRIEKRHFGQFDELLDRALSGPRWLGIGEIAEIVTAKLHDMDGVAYKLIAYCIMSNHVHLLVDMAGYDQSANAGVAGSKKQYPVADFLSRLKGSTARMCNLVLQREGSFWHKESYDHCVRDSDELVRIIQYIQDNPVKAGLAKDWQEWHHTYCHLAAITDL